MKALRLFVEEVNSPRDATSQIKPFFVFVSWNSVSRPLTQAITSLSPISPDGAVIVPFRVVDKALFHIPSVWGESKSAANIAMGKRRADWHGYPVVPPGAANPPQSMYDVLSLVKREQFFGKDAPIDTNGIDLPLSIVVEGLIDLKDHLNVAGTGLNRKVKLHAIGHSLGAKVMGMATLRAVQRREKWLESCIPANARPGGPFVDTMILFNCALTETELFSATNAKPLASFLSVDADTARDFSAAAAHIGRKAIVYSRRDIANQWVYGLSQFLISHDAVLKSERMRQKIRHALNNLARGLRVWDAPPVIDWVWRPFCRVYLAGADIGGTACVLAGAAAQTQLCNAYQLFPWTRRSRLAYYCAVGSRGFHSYAYSLADTPSRMTVKTYAKGCKQKQLGLCWFLPIKKRVTDECHGEVFLRLSDDLDQKWSSIDGAGSADDRFTIFSLDATEVYNKFDPFVGAHNDLRSGTFASDRDARRGLQKLRRTFNFVHSVTQTD